MGLAEASFRAKSRTVRRSSGRLLDELLRNERLPPDELLALQAERSAAIAQFAERSTAFYGRRYAEAGVDVSRLADPAEWQRVPIIDRAMAKAHSAEFRSTESTPKTARDAKTGGSTGEPLKIQHDARVPTLALAWRMYSWWGVEPWDNLARLARWGFGRLDTVKNRVTWWPSRQIYLDASFIDTASMERFHAEIVKTRPALIEGYVGAMLEFADFLERRGLSIPAPTAIATTAAPLPETSRRRIESVLGAPVYDEYRGSEAGWIAGECAQQDGLHTFADARRVEIVDEEGRLVPPGTVGDIVVTDLTNRVFPLIRYRLGDRGSLREGVCPCGVTLPMLNKPDGRVTDVLRLPSGAVLNHRLLAMFSARPEAVRLFQIHQTSDYAITIRVVPGEDPDARTHVDTAVTALRDRISGEVPITVEYVDSLPYTGGKTKYVISDVPAQA